MTSSADVPAKAPGHRSPISLLMRRLSLRHKIIAITMLTCLPALAVVGGVLFVWGRTTVRRTMVRDLSTYAQVLAENCKAALAFGDKTDATKLLHATEAVAPVVVACVYAPDGELFAAYSREGTTAAIPPAGQLRDRPAFAGGFLVLTRPVLLDGEKIGIVCLKASLDSLHQHLKQEAQAILGALLLSALFAWLISSRLQGIISCPISHLAEVARFVGENKQYTVRAEESGGDEVGLLIRTFNEMLEQIQQRDVALTTVNEELETKVQERTADLQRSNKELREFAFVAAHDLRTPLRGIATLTDWITLDHADRLDVEGREKFQLLQGRVQRMGDLIDGMLRYLSIGRTVSPPEPVDLNMLIPEIVALLNPPAHIRVTTAGALPIVTCERAGLYQVLRHLIDNAIKYMDKPRGQVEIGCTDLGESWQCTVADNGPGIDEKYHEKVFQIFQTLAPRDERESTGIGLAIVKKTVALLGGSIWIESRPGAGTTFLFTFPKREMSVSQPQVQAGVAVGTSCDSGEQASYENEC